MSILIYMGFSFILISFLRHINHSSIHAKTLESSLPLHCPKSKSNAKIPISRNPNQKMPPKKVWKKKETTRNWLELPRDVTASILKRLGAVEILETVQKVCMLWRSLCKDPSMHVAHHQNAQ